jgi:phenylalanyl-tRNA synthetase beta chain
VSEVVTFGFGKPADMTAVAPERGEPLRLLNPLGEELSAMRTTLVPGLMGVLANNQRHGIKNVRVFEVGTVFSRRTPEAQEDERDRDLPREEVHVAVLLWGGRHDGRWYEQGQGVDFADLGGVLEDLADAFSPRVPVARAPTTHPAFSPFCAASVRLGDEVIGWAGQITPALCAHFDVSGPVLAAELELTALAAARRAPRYEPLPRFPGTRRDVAVIAPRTLSAESLRSFLAEHAGGKLGPSVVEAVRLFDVYGGKPIPETHVSLAFAIDYKSRERTLTDDEVGEAFAAVRKALEDKFHVEVRERS